MRKRKDIYNAPLDAEEKEMLKSLEKGEWESVPNISKVRSEVKQAASRYFQKVKEKRISIRVFAKDLEGLKEIAHDEGLPYQTLVTSILHKYATGRLKDVRQS